MIEPIAVDEFHFTRAWLRGEATRLSSPKSPAFQLSRKLNLPPSYLLIHRVTLGSIGVLCQLEAQGPVPGDPAEVAPGFRPRAGRSRTARGPSTVWTGPFSQVAGLRECPVRGPPGCGPASRSGGRVGVPQSS